MNNIKKSLYEGYKAAAEMVIPDLKTSNFLETGMLTKEEFKISGNMLIKNDPSWMWTKPGECLMKKHNKLKTNYQINCTKVLQRNLLITHPNFLLENNDFKISKIFL